MAQDMKDQNDLRDMNQSKEITKGHQGGLQEKTKEKTKEETKEEIKEETKNAKLPIKKRIKKGHEKDFENNNDHILEYHSDPNKASCTLQNQGGNSKSIVSTPKSLPADAKQNRGSSQSNPPTQPAPRRRYKVKTVKDKLSDKQRNTIEKELKPISMTDEELKTLFDQCDQKIKESINKKDLEYANRNIRNAQKIIKETIRKCMGKQKKIL